MLEAALPTFLLTYALISLQRFRGFQLSRPIASLFGAALMVVFGVLAWSEALGAVSQGLEILALLLGAAANLITAEVARSHGFDFNWLRFTAIGLPVSLLALAISTMLVAFAPL